MISVNFILVSLSAVVLKGTYPSLAQHGLCGGHFEIGHTHKKAIIRHPTGKKSVS